MKLSQSLFFVCFLFLVGCNNKNEEVASTPSKSLTKAEVKEMNRQRHNQPVQVVTVTNYVNLTNHFEPANFLTPPDSITEIVTNFATNTFVEVVTNFSTNIVVVENKKIVESLVTNYIIAPAFTNMNDFILSILNGMPHSKTMGINTTYSDIRDAVNYQFSHNKKIVMGFLISQAKKPLFVIFIYILISMVLFHISKNFLKASRDKNVPEWDKYRMDRSNYVILQWFFKMCGITLIIIAVAVNGMDVLKVFVGSRQYVVDYTAKVIQG